MDWMRTAAILMFVLLSSGCGGGKSPESSPVTGGSVTRVVAGPPRVKTLTLRTTQPGRIEAFEQTPLYPKISGYVENVLVDIGDPVAKDQPLVTLSVPELEDERKQKEAMRASARAAVGQAEAAVQAADAARQTAAADGKLARAGVGRAEGEFERWRSEFDRIKQLGENRSVTEKVVEETRNQYRSAESGLQEAKANVESADASQAEAEANHAKALADLAAAKAEEQVAEANLARVVTMQAYTQLRSPFAGVVTARNVDTGHFLNEGTKQPMLTVARMDRVRVFVDIPEAEAAFVDSGPHADAATIRVQSIAGGREFPAPVTRTAWSLDPANRSLRTELDLENPEGTLRPGMFATVTIVLEERADVLTLPSTAIVRDDQGTSCRVVADDKIVSRPVQIGFRTGGDVQIVSGLAPTETVVSVNPASLVIRQPVEVLPPKH